MLKVLELFAGIGACSKALTRLGIEHEIVDAVEIDKYAVKSFNAVHGTNFEPQDIKEWDKDIECDLIMHGSPCQDFSVAGLNKGGDKGSGTRSSLMYETLRIVEKIKPKYVIWENVKNLLSKKHRHNFDAYLEAIEKLGYHSQYQVLNAKDFGVPQNRERVFTVSIRNDLNVDFKFPKPQELTVRLKDVLEPQVDEKYYLSNEQTKRLKMTTYNTGSEKVRVQNTDGEARTLCARDYKDPKCVRVAGNLNHYNYDKMNRVYDSNGLAPTVDTMEGGGRQPKIVAQRGRAYRGEPQHFEERKDGLTNTLTSVQKDNYVAEPTPLQKEVCNRAIEEGYVEPNDAIEYTYSNARLNETDNGHIKKQNIKDNTIMSTLKTNPQQIGITVDQPIQIKTANKQGYDTAQDGDAVDLTYPNSTTRRGRVGHGVSKTLPAEGGCMGVVEYRTKNKRVIETAEKSNFKNGETEYLDIYNKTPRKDTTSTINAGTDSHQNNIIGNNYRIRKLTPKECWRLMGFDDEDFEKAEKVNSNAQLYKQAGNSIVVDVLENILRNLLKDQ